MQISTGVLVGLEGRKPQAGGSKTEESRLLEIVGRGKRTEEEN